MKTRLLPAFISLSALFLISARPVTALPAQNSMEQLEALLPAGLQTPTAHLPPLRAAPEADASAAYNAFFENADAAFDSRAVERLKSYKVIFVPGFLSDVDYAQFHIPGLKAKQYFDEQMGWLKGLGADFERLTMKSESSVKENSAIVAAAIRASDKPVLLIAHSKGGLDALDALISEPTLRAKVRGFVALQSPFFGSPVADYVSSNNHLNNLAVKTLLRLGGNKESMVNLTCADRKPYMTANAAAIAEVTGAVPMLAMATWKDPVDGKFDTSLKPIRDFMYEKGIQNDGLVPADSAVLPGAALIRAGGLDHLVTVRPSRTINLDRIKFTKALLLTLFSR